MRDRTELEKKNHVMNEKCTIYMVYIYCSTFNVHMYVHNYDTRLSKTVDVDVIAFLQHFVTVGLDN